MKQRENTGIEQRGESRCGKARGKIPDPAGKAAAGPQVLRTPKTYQQKGKKESIDRRNINKEREK